MRKIPPLNSLKAFEASARLCSFTQAAHELCVTQGAISKQVKILEGYLGAQLFVRQYQHLELTPLGASYLSAVRSALETIEQATFEVCQHKTIPQTLRLNILPSLSQHWLIPRLEQFKQQQPHIAVNLEMGDQQADFDLENIDVAIRASTANQWPDVYTEVIMREELIPVCCPSLKPTSRSALVNTNLLQHTTRPDMWPMYLAAIGEAEIEVDHQLSFEHFFMLIEAAKSGMGIALIPRLFIQNELEKGILTIAFQAEYESPYIYYLICKKDRLATEKVQQFKGWLISLFDQQ